MRNALALSAAAIALLVTSVGSPAVAQVALPPSDTLQVGDLSPVLSLPESVPEDNSLQQGLIITIPGQTASGFHKIALTDPGTTNISDIVIADIEPQPGDFLLTVTFTSDNETPLTGMVDKFIAETGAVQNLSTDFQHLFGLTGTNPLPAINVMSDVEGVTGVPEPSTWAMMLVGFGLLGVAGYWRRRSVAIAA
jgi:hypothetical protein